MDDRRTISYKEQWIMVNLYKSLVRPHVEQCVSVWSRHYQRDNSPGAAAPGNVFVASSM